MRLNTLEKLYNTLKYEWPEVTVDEAVAEEAVEPFQEDAGNFGEAGIMTFVKDNKMWLIKDVSVILKSKGNSSGKDLSSE